MSKRVFVVINPASGQPKPILNQLNTVFHAAEVAWQIGITQNSGDAQRFASEAAAAGYDVVAACGGDGTVMEVADGLLGTDTPMAILPGGTANLMSVELGIPKDLIGAAGIIVDEASVVRKVDMGKVGERRFILRLGVGYAAEKVRIADRDMKNRFGLLAYSVGALKALATTRTAHYRLTIDGETHTIDGVTCMVDNAGNMGNRYVTHGRQISVSDGVLDVLVGRLVPGETELMQMQRYAGKQITIDADPPQPVQGDGELWGETPVTVEVMPAAVGILVPGG